MKGLWTEPSVTFQGRFYQLDDATIFPKPISRPIPQYVATGRDERALRRAGRYGDGWITTVSDAGSFTADLRKVRDSARVAGRDAGPAGLYATFHLDRDGDKARREAPEHIQAYFGAHHRGEQNDFFGSPEEIAQRLRDFVGAGLSIVIIRFVEQDLAKQISLMQQAMRLLRPRGG